MDDTTQPIGLPPPAPHQPGDPPPASLASRLLRMVLVGAAGLVLLCGLMASFIRVLVKGNSIQAATGMFYLAVIMALAAEFAAKVYFFPA